MTNFYVRRTMQNRYLLRKTLLFQTIDLVKYLHYVLVVQCLDQKSLSAIQVLHGICKSGHHPEHTT